MPVLSVGNVFSSPVLIGIKVLIQGRNRIPVFSVGNVFQRSPVFTHIRECIQVKSPIAVLTVCIRDLTRGRSRIPVLSVGNVFHRSPIFTNIRNLT
ncbi:unnamed protein product [Staurois parvus]|uniref:Uncharacterized protein n=1 Tax=Staurois parvus TaxID=386267 RepID=A0ABN9B7X3_9NEOB|nr:unnamed protein product [Staurois parvus]